MTIEWPNIILSRSISFIYVGSVVFFSIGKQSPGWIKFTIMPIIILQLRISNYRTLLFYSML